MKLFQKDGPKIPPHSRNRNFQLSTPIDLAPSVSTPLQPLSSPAYEEVPMWNILPSYQLYESTFSKNVNPLSEDLNFDPPTYDATSPAATPPFQAADDYFLLQPTEPNRWENSILGNTHKLKRLETFNSQLAEKVKVDIKLTLNPGKRGFPPVYLDALAYEFLQGDSIHGYVTVLNLSRQQLSFDMFSVIFEGRVSVNGDESGKPAVFYKFLNMFDYAASWTPALLDDSTESYIDPIDGCRVALPDNKTLEIGVTYKKFFSFTIPEKLLDCACETHNILCHSELAPSLGLDRHQFLQGLRKLREKPPKLERPALGRAQSASLDLLLARKPQQNLRVKDFSFPDTSISYCVEARIVGKLSSYGGAVPASGNDKFIIVKEASSSIRVIPREMNHESIATREFGAQMFYDDFVRDIRNSIEVGRKLEEGGTTPLVALGRRPSAVKYTQLYNTEQAARPRDSPDFEVFLPYRKKALTLPPKVIGILGAKTSKREYAIKYCAPYTFKEYHSHALKDATRVLTVPVEVSFIFANKSKTSKPPEIKSVSADLVACTYRSKKYPIPVEFFQEMRFQNKASGDTLEKLVVQPFHGYLGEITRLAEKRGLEILNLNNQAIMDIKCLANLSVKYNAFKIDLVTTKTAGGLGLWSESAPGKFQKSLQVTLNLEGLFSRDANRLSDDLLAEAGCLVPSFQTCIVGRYYYINVMIRLLNNEVLTTKVPIRIEK